MQASKVLSKKQEFLNNIAKFALSNSLMLLCIYLIKKIICSFVSRVSQPLSAGFSDSILEARTNVTKKKNGILIKDLISFKWKYRNRRSKAGFTVGKTGRKLTYGFEFE